MQHAVELAGLGGLGHLHRRLGPQHLEREREALLVGGAGFGVRDHQQRLGHGRTIRQPRPRDLGSVTSHETPVLRHRGRTTSGGESAMPATVIVGAQWGDEGKGKATDLLGSSVDYVVKFNGGNNAGHTVVIGDQKYALHLLPSGILTPGVTPVIGNGVVVDLGVLFEEIDGLEARGVDTSRAQAQRQRPRDRRLQPLARQGHRAVPRLPQDRHHRPRHRPHLRRQDEPHRHPGAGPLRREDPRGQGRGRPRAEEPDPHQDLQPARGHRRRDRRGAALLRRPARALRLRHRPAAARGARPRRDRAARGRPGHAARRRPRHLPVRHVELGHRRAAPAPAPASRPPASTR